MGRVSWPELPPPRADRPRVVLDLAPIEPGQGGGGGGIWSYASALARELDALDPADMEVVCLTNPRQELGLERVRELPIPIDTRSRAARLEWIHSALPAFCRRHGVGVLHKLATEVPWRRLPCRLVTTVHDFMAEHYHEQPSSPGGEELAAGLAGRSLGQRIHDAYFRAMGRRCFQLSDLLIVVSRAVEAEAGSRFPAAADRLRVVHQGIALSPAAGLHDGRRSPPRPVAGRADVLSVGALLPHKGQLLAMRGVEALAESLPATQLPVTLTLHGHAPDPRFERHLHTVASRLPPGVMTRFRRYERSMRGPALYEGADALLQLSSYEGFGLPPLEAQAAGVPVVCSDIPVFREVLGDAAVFVDRERPEQVAAELRRLLSDRAHRRALVERGLANAAGYGWRRTAEGTLAVYREAVAGLTLPRAAG